MADIMTQANQGVEEFRLNTLLEWAVLRGGVPVKVTGLRKRALLTYLILDHRQSHRRDVLAALLWPGKEVAKARASLRQTLTDIRRALGAETDVILTAPDEVTVADRGMSSDLSQLTDLLDRLAEEPAVSGLSLGQALDEFLGVSEAFDDWVRAQQALVQKRARNHLASIFGNEDLGFEYRARYAALALALDEFDEEAIRAQMQCEAGMNNPSAALRLYGAFYERLEEVMDAEPSSETQDLAVQIKLANAPTGGVPAPRPAPIPAQVLQPVDPFVSTTVAVLPFESMGGQPVPDYVLLGILDQITCHLSSFKAPAVISSNSTRKYLGKTPEPLQVGAELGANYVVTGVIIHGDPSSHVSVQLAETKGARVIWSSRQVFDTKDLFGFDAGLAEHIASAIVPSVNVSELQSIHERENRELEPYHLVLRAKEKVFQFTEASILEASALIEQAVAMSPYFAPAHTLRAECYAIAMWQGWSTDPGADRRRMDAHLRQAISAAPDYGRALALWGHNRHMFDRETTGPLNLFERAVALSPNDSETLIWTVPCTCMNGFADTAIARGRKAIELSPLDPFQFRNEHFLSLAYYVKGDFDTAAEYGMSSYRLAPNYSSNLRATIAALVSAGRMTETIDLVAQHATVEPDFSVEKFIPNHGLRDPQMRAQFGERLIEAGLPR